MRIHVPVINVTDILIAGFSSGGVEAALAARTAGRQVFMISPETYPGSDICGPLHYWLDPSQSPESTPWKGRRRPGVRTRRPGRRSAGLSGSADLRR